jgi:ABC-type antimicrobial peptide transport system permease subunit
MLRGREFNDGDSLQSAPVAVVSEALARRLWPAGDVLGSTLVVANQARTIVGIVEDLSLEKRTETITPYVYVPFWQNPGQVDARLCIRVKGDPQAMLPALAREVNRVDPDVPVAEAITLPAQMAGAFRPLRLSAVFIGYAAALTAVLSAIGLYASLAFAVSRRTREIGIRMAIGAEPRRVRGEILGEGMTVVLGGVMVGVFATAAGVTLVQRLLYGSAAHDALFFASAAALVAGGGLLACWVPARRASSVDPVVALRTG